MPTAPDFDLVVRRLRAAGCVFAEDEARLLIDESLDEAQLERDVARRVAGEPLEYILGWAEFRGLRIAVAPRVFVPRQRTSVLVQEALRLAPRAPVVLDLCCGAGAIGAAILDARPDAAVHAADIDPAAADCARRTLASVSASFGSNTASRSSDTASHPEPRVYVGDLYAPLPASLRGAVDLIVANAPYVPTDEIRLMPPEAREHEALAALDGGDDGLALQRRVADGARGWLRSGGHLLIETSRRQASATAGILESAGFTVSIVHDDDVDGTAAIGTLL
ncbi:putative protein N(5)-glutamine methyltransferase [Rathayibacter sp. CAU 1779]